MQPLPFIHKSADTAYLISDYPYSFQLRCQKRLWLEYKPKRGYRVMAQTSNPRTSNGSAIVWNTPKASIYHRLCVLYLDENNHVQLDALSSYEVPSAVITAFKARYEAIFTEGLQETQHIDQWIAFTKGYEASRAAH